MSREVIKHVGGRAYRYVVERVADVPSGKTKRRWRYVGPVRPEPASGASEAESDARSTRDRLLDAFERLLEDRTFAAVTISAVGRKAGLAHGTFYRYFRDKEALLDAAIDRMRSGLGFLEPQAGALGRDVGSQSEERERVARWLGALTAIEERRMALIRAWYLQRTATGDLAAERKRRRGEQIARLTAYLEALDRARLARIDDARGLAIGIYAAIDGVMRRAIFEAEPLDPETTAALRAIVSRSIFGPDGSERCSAGPAPRPAS